MNLSWIFDIFFPPRCVACHQYGSWWCESCCRKVEPAPYHSFQGLDGFYCLGYYHDPILRAAIHGLKYRGGRCVLPAMVDFADRQCEDGRYFPWIEESGIAVQAIPTDEDRVRERGFDQAVLIRDAFLPLFHEEASAVDILRRVGKRQAQAGIQDDYLRQANISGIFELKPGTRVPEAVLLIDDVATTGATMGEAAKILRGAGAKRVYGFAIALGA